MSPNTFLFTLLSPLLMMTACGHFKAIFVITLLLFSSTFDTCLSESKTGIPNFVNIEDIVDFPIPIDPVIPIIFVIFFAFVNILLIITLIFYLYIWFIQLCNFILKLITY